jgi:hypothetical protein
MSSIISVRPRGSLILSALAAGWLIGGWLARAMADDSVAGESAAAEPPAFRRILTNWRARHDRFKTLHFELRSHYAHPVLERLDARYEIWLDRRMHYQIATENAAEHETRQNAFDGVTSREIVLRNASGVGKFAKGDDGLPLQEPAVEALLMAMLPAAETGSDRHEVRFITENAILDGKHFVKLERGGARLPLDTYWIDPARGDVVVNWERRWPNLQWRINSIECRHDEKYGWIPATWNETTNYPSWGRSFRVTKYEINEDLPAGIFAPAFPPGTLVFDKDGTEKFVLAKDGQKRDRVKFDSAQTMHVDEILEQTTDFEIAPEPVKDAIDFIQQRYQINLAIERQLLYGLNKQVKPQSSGIKVRRLIESLLQQSPIPLRYEVRRGALVIEPANRPK